MAPSTPYGPGASTVARGPGSHASSSPRSLSPRTVYQPGLTTFVAIINSEPPHIITVQEVLDLIQTCCFLTAFPIVERLRPYLKLQTIDPGLRAQILATISRHAPQLKDLQFTLAKELGPDLQITPDMKHVASKLHDVRREDMLDWITRAQADADFREAMELHVLAVYMCDNTCDRSNPLFNLPINGSIAPFTSKRVIQATNRQPDVTRHVSCLSGQPHLSTVTRTSCMIKLGWDNQPALRCKLRLQIPKNQDATSKGCLPRHCAQIRSFNLSCKRFGMWIEPPRLRHPSPPVMHQAPAPRPSVLPSWTSFRSMSKSWQSPEATCRKCTPR